MLKKNSFAKISKGIFGKQEEVVGWASYVSSDDGSHGRLQKIIIVRHVPNIPCRNSPWNKRNV
ncbi:MAG: hypothetical protein BGO78_11490 [Chloroflexi bacterium 44-23]|nr:MAG: hypothetical protein BGO78_11490 [Chloroflexi bacterium 44-23]